MYSHRRSQKRADSSAVQLRYHSLIHKLSEMPTGALTIVRKSANLILNMLEREHS